MIEIELRALRAADFAAADALREAAGWNQTLADWARFLECAPDGCFVAELEGVVVGTATTIAYGGELGWIGMLLVHPDHRGRGIGSQLLRRSMEHLEGCGVRCIKLDATPAGKRVYERFDFKTECNLHRWERSAPDLPPSAGAPSAGGVSASELESMVALDREAFGVDRHTLLTAVAARALRIIAAPEREDGFGMLRRGARAYYLGSIQAKSAPTARAIVGRLLDGLPDGPVFWDILEPNREARGVAQDLGFAIQRPLVRMHRGPNRIAARPEWQYGIIDPAVG